MKIHIHCHPCADVWHYLTDVRSLPRPYSSKRAPPSCPILPSSSHNNNGYSPDLLTIGLATGVDTVLPARETAALASGTALRCISKWTIFNDRYRYFRTELYCILEAYITRKLTMTAQNSAVFVAQLFLMKHWRGRTAVCQPVALCVFGGCETMDLPLASPVCMAPTCGLQWGALHLEQHQFIGPLSKHWSRYIQCQLWSRLCRCIFHA